MSAAAGEEHDEEQHDPEGNCQNSVSWPSWLSSST